MPSFIRFFCLVLMSSAISCFLQAQTAQKPLTDSELMALVAGNALSENIVYQVTTRGLAFHPDAIYKTQLKSAGGDALVLSSVDKAKVVARARAEEGPSELEVITHLSNAGRLLRMKQYDASTSELTAALKNGADAEAGFVMGEVLRREEQFDMAMSVYQKVLRQNPNFPETHTKLAYILYRAERVEDAMREAQLVLAQNPNNAEAHKNLALTLLALREYDASIAEFRESLRIKPDYAGSHFDLGLAYDEKHDVAAAIQEYRKAVALDPSEAEWHYNLAIQLKNTGDTEGAIHEYREAKRVAPDRVDVRHNLALCLVDVDPDASVKEFHDLIAMAPDFELAHVGLGMAYSREGKPAAAEREERIAITMDPTDSIAHSNLGSDLEVQNKYDEAMQEFVRAAELDNDSPYAHAGIGLIYLHQKKYADAVRELRRAELLNTSFADVHRELAEALEGLGSLDAAIAEMKQAETLDPENATVMSKLARMFEKSGDYKAALEQYRLAAETGRTDDARKEYAAAQQRLHGKAGIPESVPGSGVDAKKTVNANSESSTSEFQWNDALDASQKALAEKRYEDAEKTANAALAKAEKLSPRDQRLLRSIYQLAWVYSSEQKYHDAKAVWQQYLKASREISGPESREVINALDALGSCAYEEKDFTSAAVFFAQAIELTEKLFGPENLRVSRDLYFLGNTYQAQGAYEKAESIFLKLMQTNTANGSDGLFVQGDLLQLGRLYLAWGKLDKAESYCRKSLAVRENAYGSDSPMLSESLQTLSEVLGRLGKTDEAAQLKKRQERIIALAGQSESKP